MLELAVCMFTLYAIALCLDYVHRTVPPESVLNSEPCKMCCHANARLVHA